MPEIDQALQHHRAGRLQEAEALYRQILTTTPNHADALHMLGLLSAQTGKHEAAMGLIERAIQVNPNIPDYHNNLGEIFRALGKAEAAIGAYQRALTHKPNYAAARYNLGMAFQAQGNLTEAIATYRQALVLEPNTPEIYNNLGIALNEQGSLDDAVATFERARALNPNLAETHYNLGNAHKAQDKLPDAIAAYRKAIKLRPDFAEAYNNLGSALKEQGKLVEAIASCKQAITLKPDYAEAYNNLGTALRAHGEVDAAISSYKQVLVLKPDYDEAYNNLGIALTEQSKLSEAISAYQLGLALNPDSTEIRYNLANALLGQGKLTAAISTYRQALTFEQKATDIHSSLICCLNYCADVKPTDVLAEHRRWSDQHAAPLANDLQPHANSPDPNRRLRIGYLSPDFRRHSVAFFVEPLLTAHDRRVFEVFCYANVRRPDAVTERFRGLADRWRDIVNLSDEQVAELVRADAVDILVDLVGHTADSRLLVFARKPAPVQISYLGYPNTTGLATMDYRLTDSWADPPGETDRLHVEQLVRLPGCFLCYQPLPESPEVSPLPALTSGHVTFASFNNASKVTPETVALWAKILRALPEARLIMKAFQLGDSGTQHHFKELFKKNRVSLERITFVGWIPSISTHLELYNKVDIGLDPFPYHGTTTTCEALWMGVPVVSLAGQTHASGVGVSLLSNVGLPELIADTPKAYVELAISLAADLDRLRQLRAGLRAKVAGSPLTDKARFARALEHAYRNVWHGWCRQQRHPAASRGTTPRPGSQSASPLSRQAPSLIVRIRGDIQVCVPNSVVLLTPYVLLEQEDWFEDEIGFARELLKPGMHAVDIGASYGVYSLVMARVVGPNGKMWSFEPTRGPAAFLEESIKQNKLTNVAFRQIGLSNRGGAAKLGTNANSELNTLTRGGNFDGDFEMVELSTLDDCMRDPGCGIIDFVKMDAEGEESRIVEGGNQFFSEQSPLVLFELKHGDALNVSLLQKFRDIGYATYRLVPGLNILVPFDADQKPDPYQLNLFCCKPDRAEILEEQGLLVKGKTISTEVSPMKTLTWRDLLYRLPYAQNLLKAWEESSRHLPDDAAYHQALDHYAQAHMGKSPPALRYGYLERSFVILSEIIEREGNICRLQSLARVSWEIGKRKVALRVLGDLIARLDKEEVTLTEPFLAVSRRFERLEPGDSVKEWCMASAREQQEKLCAFSSYFTGKNSLHKLAMMKNLPFYGPEMERRRQLIQLRYHMQHEPESHSVLASPTEDNLNAAFWVGKPLAVTQ